MTWMLTAGGRKITVDAIEPQDIAIEDLAAHLAKICRFTGACRIQWSVAEHSLLVSEILADEYPLDHDLQLCGLLHDAPEAYLQDLATPVKAHVAATYKPLERAAWYAVAERFGLPLSMPREVEHADLVALATERRDLMPAHAEQWSVLEGIKPIDDRVGRHERHWSVVQDAFLNRFHQLIGQRAIAAAGSVA